ncbi:MAG: hemerythrin domain-containing protein, partial [Gammaproteobacteria bacterium]
MSSLLPGPAPGYEQPFAMLEACHERVHRMLDLLERLRAYLPDHGADRSARDAARDVMRYFDQAAPNHHRDEELHVFPPLLAGGDADTAALVRRLQQDHVRMESAWQSARAVLARIEGNTVRTANTLNVGTGRLRLFERFAGGRMWSLASAEAYFRRPPGAPARIEYA